MSDIAMCTANECPFKNTCRRFSAVVDHNKSYANFWRYKAVKCVFYMSKFKKKPKDPQEGEEN